MPRTIHGQPIDERLWRKAKRIVAQGMAERGYEYDDPYAVVMKIYKAEVAAKKKPKKSCKNPHTCSCAACKKRRRPKKPRA